MSSHVVPMFRRDHTGRISHRYFNGDAVAQAAIDGWYDSPDKVPGTLPGQKTGEDLPHPESEALNIKPGPQVPFGKIHGEELPTKRKGGWPLGKKRGPRKAAAE